MDNLKEDPVMIIADNSNRNLEENLDNVSEHDQSLKSVNTLQGVANDYLGDMYDVNLLCMGTERTL